MIRCSSSAPVDRHPDVGQRGGRQDVAKDVAGLGPARSLVRPLGLSLAARRLGSDGGHDRLHQAGVRVEQESTRVLVQGRVGRRHDAGLAVELVPVEDDVAGGLLGEGGQAGVLEHLAGDDGDVLDRQVGHGVLGDGGVAVPHHPLLVELLGLPLCQGEIVLLEIGPGQASLQIQVVVLDELQQVTPQALAASAVVGEEDGHDLFGQVPQGEDRAIDVGDVGSKDRNLVRVNVSVIG